MKRSVQWLLSAVVALAMMCAGTQAYSASTTTFQANGVSAQTMTCTNNCSNQIYLTLNSSKSGGTTSWYVFFAVSGTDASGNPTSIAAGGQIPASMVSGNGNSSLTLNLDTNAAGLQVTYCVADQSYNYTCTPYSGGVLTVNWQTTSFFSQHIVAQNQQTYGPYTLHTNTQSDMSSATAQSNAFGAQFSDQFASLGTSHQGTVSITKP